MQWFVFLFLCTLLLPLVRSNQINEEIHSEGFKSKLWSTNRTLTWKLDYDHSLYDSRKTYQDIQQAFDDWARYTELTFREATEGEKADFNLAFVSGDHSDGTPFDGPGEQVSHSFLPENSYAGHIHFDSTEKWSHEYDGIGYNLRLVAAHEIGSSLGLLHSDDRDSIMSLFYQVILPKEMLPQQDQDSIQALYGKKKNPMTTAPPSRHVRSAKIKKSKTTKKQKQKVTKHKHKQKVTKHKQKQKVTKHKQKQKVTKHKQKQKQKVTKQKQKATKQKKKQKATNKRATTETQRTTTEKNIKMTDERQMVTFNASEQARIVKAIKGLQSDGALTEFKNLSETIKLATGMLPQKFIPVLQKLSASYSITTKTIKVGFADSCAVLSKFVIKSWCIIQRGMNKEEENALMTLGNQLNTDFKNELAKFVDLSRSDLVNIYSQLLLETAGNKIEDLLKQKDALEIDLLQRSEELTNKSSQCGTIRGKIDPIKYQQQIYNIAIRDSKAAKLEMNEEITRLKSQISDYEQKVKQNRDTRRKERGRFWIFSWKVQDVHIDNGERIARENLNRLLDRIRVLEKRLNNWSSRSFTEQMKKATTSLSRYETMKIQLEKEHKNLKELYEQTEQKFHVLIQQIDEIYRSTGTANVKSIKTVNELCFALQTGSESLISACNKIRTHLARIDLDPNSLVDAVLDALQLINMGDEYNDSTKIKDIKRVLALE
ncbi:unnamed protein product [Rotaria magnacalcarata]|uniref:Peptidase metallopeptidase domain-containing protein n=7 Tax=Rotaria magnacalcarata TaxID=392030 RepID=A0A815LV91_9BILA|nr:unnamed protein product [Rotaria magnacalcarata]CAF1412795.1 unnamed protein product [Rotaria magnacalcarata]